MMLPPSPKKRLAGAKAVRNGRAFEDLFESMCRIHFVNFTAIPDGCRVVGRGRLLRVPTPFDYVASYHGMVALLDTKTVQGKRFVPSDIKKHQLSAMLDHPKVLSGYLILFREVNYVGWLPSGRMREMIRDGKGVAAEELACLGSTLAFDPRKIFGEIVRVSHSAI